MNPPELSDAQLLRYNRHLLLPELGIEGQGRLSAASALIVGAGGLGCPAAMYLAACGLRSLTLADGDTVDLSNLQRQIGHTTADIGRPKVESLRACLRALNPECVVDALPRRLEGTALEAAVRAHDLVLDCSDNFATRFALNQAACAHQKPLVSGAAIRFEGQVSVFDFRAGTGPCYRCLYPEAGTVETTCSENGVLAPLVGVIGALQAAEAVKLISGAGEPLHGRLLLFDALAARWRELRLPADPACPVCAPATASRRA